MTTTAWIIIILLVAIILGGLAWFFLDMLKFTFRG